MPVKQKNFFLTTNALLVSTLILVDDISMSITILLVLPNFIL